jgi:hypothetical protein
MSAIDTMTDTKHDAVIDAIVELCDVIEKHKHMPEVSLKTVTTLIPLIRDASKTELKTDPPVCRFGPGEGYYVDWS